MFLLRSDTKTTKKWWDGGMKKIWIVAFLLVIVGFVGLYIGYLTHPATEAVNSSASISSSSPASAQLSANMRALWEDHVFWTRMYLIDLASNNGFADADLSRLMKNQEAIGSSIKPYYGNVTVDTATHLLKQDISAMVAFATATKDQDATAQSNANTQWYANAKQIATFLIKTNPNLENTDLQLQIKPYLDATKQEITDIFNKKYQASIADFDSLNKQSLQVADMLSIGIRQQFPEKF